MDMEWNLDKLYTSFDDPQFKEDYSHIKCALEDLSQWALKNFNTLDNAAVKILTYLERKNGLVDRMEKYHAFARLTVSVDATNKIATNAMERMESCIARIAVLDVSFLSYIAQISDIDNLINSNEQLKTYDFHIHEVLDRANYTLDATSENIVVNMQKTGSKAWSKLQRQLVSTLLVDISLDGEQKKLPLPVVRNMAFNSDRTIRKEAYEAEIHSYSKIAKSSAACLNGIKGEVLTLCNMRGFESPLQLTLIHARMDEKILQALLTAMEESLPSFHQYFKKKASLLGHKEGLPFYDLFAPVTKEDFHFTFEEASAFIVKQFSKYSTKLGAFAKHAFTNNWIDAKPRTGKVGGAFCANLHSIGESRILANFNGSLSNVITLAHELGHGYHGCCIKDEVAINSNYTMPVAETASIFCETIVTNAALESATTEQRISILEEELQGASKVIVDIYSRYIFETELFKRRQNGSLSVDELCHIMMDAQKKAYGDGLDSNTLHPYMWLNKTHYYYPSKNFYNFPYAFGLLFGKGLYAIYLEKGQEFVYQYDKLLASTGKKSVYDIGQMMGIDLHDIDFFRKGLKIIQNSIEEYLKL